MSPFDQVFQEEIEGLSLLGYVAVILVVGTVLFWVPSAGVRRHNFRPLKEGFILEFAHQLVNRLCEHIVYSPVGGLRGFSVLLVSFPLPLPCG